MSYLRWNPSQFYVYADINGMLAVWPNTELPFLDKEEVTELRDALTRALDEWEDDE